MSQASSGVPWTREGQETAALLAELFGHHTSAQVNQQHETSAFLLPYSQETGASTTAPFAFNDAAQSVSFDGPSVSHIVSPDASIIPFEQSQSSFGSFHFQALEPKDRLSQASGPSIIRRSTSISRPLTPRKNTQQATLTRSPGPGHHTPRASRPSPSPTKSHRTGHKSSGETSPAAEAALPLHLPYFDNSGDALPLARRVSPSQHSSQSSDISSFSQLANLSPPSSQSSEKGTGPSTLRDALSVPGPPQQAASPHDMLQDSYSIAPRTPPAQISLSAGRSPSVEYETGETGPYLDMPSESMFYPSNTAGHDESGPGTHTAKVPFGPLDHLTTAASGSHASALLIFTEAGPSASPWEEFPRPAADKYQLRTVSPAQLLLSNISPTENSTAAFPALKDLHYASEQDCAPRSGVLRNRPVQKPDKGKRRAFAVMTSSPRASNAPSTPLPIIQPSVNYTDDETLPEIDIASLRNPAYNKATPLGSPASSSSHAFNAGRPTSRTASEERGASKPRSRTLGLKSTKSSNPERTGRKASTSRHKGTTAEASPGGSAKLPTRKRAVKKPATQANKRHRAIMPEIGENENMAETDGVEEEDTDYDDVSDDGRNPRKRNSGVIWYGMKQRKKRTPRPTTQKSRKISARSDSAKSTHLSSSSDESLNARRQERIQYFKIVDQYELQSETVL